MAKIDNIRDFDKLRELVLELDGPGLIAQHLVQRDAAHALETAIELGATLEMLRTMLNDVRTMQDFVAVTAAMRGIRLVSEE
ncbi:hypothetical protein [Paraburkholderia xenovorans]|jgi:hypothetical protein